jgi:uncharacterized membrane protein YfcA
MREGEEKDSNDHARVVCVLRRYRGYVDVKIAALICPGFFFGGLLGAKLATSLSNAVLEEVFGIALLLIAVKMILAK